MSKKPTVTLDAMRLSRRRLLTGRVAPVREQRLALNTLKTGRPPAGMLLASHVMRYAKKPLLPRGLVWKPDSSLLAAFGGYQFYVWAAAGDLRAVYEPLGPPTQGAVLAWTPDGRTLSFLNADGQTGNVYLALWDVAAPETVQEFRLGPEDVVYALAWAPRGNKVAVAIQDRVIVCSPTSDGRLVTSVTYPPQLPPGGQPSYIVAWSPDGQTIASAGHTHAVQFWEAATGRPLHYFPEQTKAIAAAWSPDGRTLAYLTGAVPPPTSGQQVPLTVVVREVESGRLLLSVPATYPAVPISDGREGIPLLQEGLTWSPDNRRLAIAGQGPTVQVWEVGSQRLLLTYRGHRAPVVAVAWAPNGRWLASASSDGEVRVWQAP
ncbi:MAG: PD40 domain-containing protein [Thermogemmatispora sp.]|uniref:WD40 repeat domain-containing protein n=1 Tax=Thermogemmatispora sp. TaxID=1968838 RepID=UPI00260EA031|nr:hypothetical protein [Thermogemmatispora sp.]MBX5458962.1 PD40 domain-containing protein [Thermogemmatispora sp.]